MSLAARQVFLLVLCYTTLAVAWGWRMHAGDPQPPLRPAERELEATRTALATRLARAKAAPDLLRPALFQLATLPDADLLALADWAKYDAEARLRRLTVQQGPVPPGPLNTALLFAELQQPDALLPEDSRLVISAAGDRLEEEHKVAALQLLATQATAARQPQVALDIHLRIIESPEAGWAHIMALAEAARQAHRPAAALRLVNLWLDPAVHALTTTERRQAQALQTALLLEGGRTAEASRLALEDLRALPTDAPLPAHLMERALLATTAAGEGVELLPWLERHLRSFPAHQLRIEEIAAGRPVPAEYRRWLGESARIADGKQHAGIACDGYFRLAAAGDLRVLARLHPLAAQTGRGTEFSALLATLQRRFSLGEIAGALTHGGLPQAAHELLVTELKSRPKDREAWRMLTEIDSTLRGSASAPGLWEGFLRRFPGDVPALQALARSQLAASQLPQALRSFQQIPEDAQDEATLRQLTTLAIQQDDLATAHRAQQRLVQGMSAPAIPDVLLLATLTRQHADAESQAALAEAISRLPAQSAFEKSLLPSGPATGQATPFRTATQSH